jgi:hypothetical protein
MAFKMSHRWIHALIVSSLVSFFLIWQFHDVFVQSTRNHQSSSRTTEGRNDHTSNEGTLVSRAGGRRASDRAANARLRIDEARLREALDNPDHAAGLNRCGILVREELVRTGSYEAIGRFMANLPPGDARALLTNWVLGVKTPLGSIRDYDHQGWLIEDLGFGDELRMTDQFFREAGGRAFAELAKERPGEFRDERFMEMSVRGAAKHLGVRTTVAALSVIPVGNALAPQMGKATEWLLAHNSTETSSSINDLSAGVTKDLMIESMIEWLARKGEHESINGWIDSISDQEVKDRVHAKHRK